ncbi:hypothetical protein [uncultured Xanthomonas sp.]|uniref:hypothetical protein n=1 Tax=uncultured Xanthomonas sp. TaxID=152831 RepID=UPI0025D7DFAC|nr:hypothetical protein [uncultured Xanthomonas sp.]
MEHEAEVLFVDKPADSIFCSPLGERWGSQIVKRTDTYLEILKSVKMVTLDAQGEYVIYLEASYVDSENEK